MLRRNFVAALAGSLGALSSTAELTGAPQDRNSVFDSSRQYQMPAHFGPAYSGKASPRYLDVTMFGVSYLTDRGKLTSLLPAPFEVGSEPLITVYCAMNREVEWLAGGEYNLLGVNASVRFNGKKDQLEGAFCLVLWENETDPILSGRELQGIPKIYADIEDHRILDGTWYTSASHRGHQIVEMTAHKFVPLSQGQLIEARRTASTNWMGWKYIPNTGRPGPAVSHATLFPVSSAPKEVMLGEGKIDWKTLTWEQNPTQAHIVNALARLPIVQYREAFVTRGASTLAVPGQSIRELH